LKAKIKAAVLAKAKEVKKYLDPSLTMSFGVAAVPDAVFDLSSGLLVAACLRPQAHHCAGAPDELARPDETFAISGAALLICL